ncbi:MAG: hypothetical protein GX102_01775 [Porphyromonadaceae bacterium]|nr:hypothetical protein [Porphyromonadaceae bacterium]
MNKLNIKYQNGKLLFAMIMVFILSACVTADFDEDINLVNNEINRLHNEDDSIKVQFTRDINALRVELVNKIDDMDKLVSDKLAQKISEIQLQLNNQHTILQKLITDKSTELGVQITDWDTRLNTLITTKNTEFENSRVAMQAALEKAIADGDAPLQAQITQGMQKLDVIQAVLPELAANTGRRMKALEDFEDKLEMLTTSIEDLEDNRSILELQINDLKDNMQLEIDNYIDDFTAGDMMEMADYLNEFIERVSDVVYGLEDYLFEIQYFILDASDFERELSNADDYISLMDDLESALSAFESIDPYDTAYNSSNLLDLMDELEELAESLEGYPVLEAVDVFEGVHELIDMVLTKFNDNIDTAEDLITEIEDYLGEFP